MKAPPLRPDKIPTVRDNRSLRVSLIERARRHRLRAIDDRIRHARHIWEIEHRR